MDAYISSIMMWGPTWAPRSWALCEGQLIAISQNSALFALIGTMYGGDGRTTFALPDLRGRVAVGAGHGSGLTPYQTGQRFGTETVTLNALQMPSHSHAASTGNLNVTTTIHANSSPLGTTDAPADNVLGNGSSYSPSEPDVQLDAAAATSDVSGNVVIGNAGGSQAHENRQPSLALNFIICLYGIFPSRN